VILSTQHFTYLLNSSNNYFTLQFWFYCYTASDGAGDALVNYVMYCNSRRARLQFAAAHHEQKTAHCKVIYNRKVSSCVYPPYTLQGSIQGNVGATRGRWQNDRNDQMDKSRFRFLFAQDSKIPRQGAPPRGKMSHTSARGGWTLLSLDQEFAMAYFGYSVLGNRRRIVRCHPIIR